jgi:HD-like signal output (HDOD) protein
MLISATELAAMHEDLDRRLDRAGVVTQPEVAIRLVELCGRPGSQLSDFARIIRTDAGLSGRLLKLANSAFFAQRRAVTTIDRACVLLGLERLKAMSLGFHLSRAAGAGAGDEGLTRRVWGEGVLRACLAAEIARHTAPALAAEAFVIGLMLDAGIPLMQRLVGGPYAQLVESADTPGALYKAEFQGLAFTHVDVMVVLARRWKLPELLARPIEWHHTRPADLLRPEPVHVLHRIAYTVGMVKPGSTAAPGQVSVDQHSAGISTARRLLNLAEEDLSTILTRTTREYSSTLEVFRDIADGLTNVDAIVEQVSSSFARCLDESIETSLRREVAVGPERFLVGGTAVELARERDGTAIAFLYDSQGHRLVSHAFVPSKATAGDVLRALGVSSAAGDDLELMNSFIRLMAA